MDLRDIISKDSIKPLDSGSHAFRTDPDVPAFVRTDVAIKSSLLHGWSSSAALDLNSIEKSVPLDHQIVDSRATCNGHMDFVLHNVKAKRLQLPSCLRDRFLTGSGQVRGRSGCGLVKEGRGRSADRSIVRWRIV